MKIWVVLSSIFLSFSLWATPELVVHFGKLSPTQERVLDRVFTARLKEYANEYSGQVEVVIQKNASSEQILESLKSPQSLAVIFLGHPAIEVRGEEIEERRIVNGFLEAADGRYLTKTFMSSAHDNLQALSILTCHESGVLPNYLKYMPEGPKYYQSPTHNIDSLSNPLFEFTSYYATPKVLKAVFDDLPNLLERYKRNQNTIETQWVELSVTYLDLLSSKFDYQVLLDGRQVGVLNASYNDRGRAKHKSIQKIKIQRSLWEKGRTLTVRPDDPKRPVREEGLNVVDDIILTKVKVKDRGQEDLLFEGIVHLGDDDSMYDSDIGLSFRRNWRFFDKAPRLDSWELSL